MEPTVSSRVFDRIDTAHERYRFDIIDLGEPVEPNIQRIMPDDDAYEFHRQFWRNPIYHTPEKRMELIENLKL